MTRKILSFAVIAVLAVTFVNAPHLRAQEKPATPGEKQSPLAKALLGTWILAGAPGDSGEAPASGGRLKFCTGRHWMITQADPQTGVTIYHHGGSYTLNGNEYAETVEYANENTKELIKQTFKFTIKIDGDMLTQTGIDNPFNEVWKRAK
jgi:hypothetical protein